MRTGAAAVAYANKITRWPVGYCLKFVRTCFGLPGGYASAKAAWYGAKYRHGPTGYIPPGVPVFLRGGKYWHIVMSLGHNSKGQQVVRSTDWPRSGQVNDVLLSTISKAWNYPVAGWSEDLQNLRIYTPPKPAVKPVPKPVSQITPLASSTKMDKTGWQVSDLRTVLHKAGYLEAKYVGTSDHYDANVARGVMRFHKAHPRYSSAPTGQIGPKGWAYLQTLAGRK